MFKLELMKQNIELNKKNNSLKKNKVDLSRKILKLTGTIDDMKEDILSILNDVENYLSANSYNNNEVKIRKTLEYVREQKENVKKYGND